MLPVPRSALSFLIGSPNVSVHLSSFDLGFFSPLVFSKRNEKNVFLPVSLQQPCRIEGLSLPINLPFRRKSNPIYSIFPIRLCFLDLLSFSKFPPDSLQSLTKIFARACCFTAEDSAVWGQAKGLFPLSRRLQSYLHILRRSLPLLQEMSLQVCVQLEVCDIHPSLSAAAPHPLLVLLLALSKFRPLQLTWITQSLIFFVEHDF